MGKREEEEKAQREYLEKCRRDVPFWMGHECMIQTKGMMRKHLELNYSQRMVNAAIQKQIDAGLPVRVIVVKGRQQGLTTFGQGYLMHRLLHEPNTLAATIAHDQLTVEKIEDRIFAGMLKGLEPPYGLKRAKGDMWDNGSMSSTLTAGSKKVGRGDTYQFVHATEMAYWHRGDLGDEQADAVVTGLLNGVPDLRGTFVLMESTADGALGAFYERYRGAKRGEYPGWTAVCLPYYKHEEYRWPLTEEQTELNNRLQVAWKDGNDARVRSLCDDLGLDDLERKWRLGGGQDGEPVPLACLIWRRMVGLPKCQRDVNLCMQEYPASDDEAFLSSGRPTFAPRVIVGWREKLEEIRVYRHEAIPNVVVWKKPVTGHRYTLGADICEGSEVPDEEKDATCGLVWDRTAKEFVALYHSQNTPRVAAGHVAELAVEYGALVVPESNGPGEGFIERMVDCDPRPEIYARELCTRFGERPKLGWKTDSKSRPTLIGYLRDRVRDNLMTVPFKIVLDEFANNVTTRTRSDHAKGKHDDCVIAAALAMVPDMEDSLRVVEEKHEEVRFDPLKHCGRWPSLDYAMELKLLREEKDREEMD